MKILEARRELFFTHWFCTFLYLGFESFEFSKLKIFLGFEKPTPSNKFYREALTQPNFSV